MKISVIGAIVYDEIITYKGERRESYGGITYNIAALSSILDRSAVIRPISNVGEDRWEEVQQLLASYPSVDTGALRRAPGKLTNTRLVYTSLTWRDETVLDMMVPLTPDRMRAAADSDAVLVNFINGTELDLPTFRALRESAPALLHMDVHSKVARWDAEGKKSLVPFEGWADWMTLCDVVQMNEFECELVVGRKPKDQADFIAAGKEILEAAGGRPMVLITLGPLGSILIYRKAGRTYASPNPADPIEKVVDTTGCGDSFSAGFLVNYLAGREPVAANAAANIVAGTNCLTAGLGGLEAARDALSQIPRVFPDLAQKLQAGWPGDEI
jgi:adenosine kinase